MVARMSERSANLKDRASCTAGGIPDILDRAHI